MKRAIPWIVALLLVVLITSCFLFEKKLSPIINLIPLANSTLIGPEVPFRWSGGTSSDDQTIYSLFLGISEEALTEVASEITSTSVDLDLECNQRYFWKVVSKTLTLAAESGVMNFYLIDGMAKNPLPSDNASEVTKVATLSWETTYLDGADFTYSVYFAEGNVPALVQEDLTENSFDPGDLKNGTKYSWKIVAKAGNQAKESPVWSFTTVPDPTNNAPAKPNTPTPADGAANQAVDVNLGWTCSDPDGDSLVYDVYFGSSETPPLVVNEQSSNAFDPGTLSKGTKYYWKIVAKDGRGGVTESDRWSFTTIPDPTNNPPTKPATPTPADEAIDQSLDVNLGWSCSDPDGDPLMYDVYFGSNPSPSLVSYEQSSNAFDPGTLSKGTTYYWKIVAKDERGGVTESDKWSFTTSNLESPHSPSPSDDATNVLWDSVILSWDVAGDTSGLYYDIYFGKDEIPGIYRIGHTSRELTITNLDRGATYYWQVVVTDQPYTRGNNSGVSFNNLEADAILRRDGAAAIGNIWSFTTKENRPPVFISMNPTDEATDISPAATLSWQFTDEDGDELVYDLYLDRVVNPRILVNNIEDSSYSPFLYGLADYYWKVVAKDGHGGITETGVYRFSTRFIEWQKCLGGSVNDRSYSVQQTSDSGYIVAGYTNSNDGDVSGNNGNDDYWVVKLDENGSIEWQKCHGGSSTDRLFQSNRHQTVVILLLE